MLKPLPKQLLDKLAFFTGQLEFIRASSIGTPKKLRIDLSVQHNDLRLPLTGNFFYVMETNAAADNLDLKVNEQREPSFTFYRGMGLLTPFYTLFITNAAQVGGYAIIIYGTQAPDFLEVIDNRSATDISNLLQEKINLETGATGTQVNKSHAGAVAGTVIIHTVSAGKTFHLVSCSLSSHFQLNNSVKIEVRDAADLNPYNILAGSGGAAAANAAVANSFPYPYLIPAGYDICCIKVGPDPHTAEIHGWED